MDSRLRHTGSEPGEATHVTQATWDSEQQTLQGRLHGDETVGCHLFPQGAVAACLNNSLPAGG